MKTTMLIVLSLLLLAAPPPAVADTPARDASFVGKPSPDFTVTNLDAKKLSLGGLLESRKIVVVNFWGLRCAACIEEMPPLNAIFNKFRDSIAVLGINTDGVDGPTLKDLMKEASLSVDYEIVPDPEFKMVDIFKLAAAPLTIVIDSRGVVGYRHEDYKPGDEKELEDVIRNMLDGKASASR